MRIIKAIFIVAICCVVSFAQQSAAQQTANPSQAKGQALSSQTGDRTLPEKGLSLFEVMRMQNRLSEALHQQNQRLPVDVETLRSQGIEVVPETRFFIKDGAIYMALTNDYLLPMTGGGASGCLPNPAKNAGQMIFIAPKTNGNQPSGQNPAKKN